jgi:hypothetical protein
MNKKPYMIIYTVEHGRLEFASAVDFVNFSHQYTIHRLHGPAVMYGSGLIEYWIEDEHYNKRAYYKKIESMGMEVKSLPPELKLTDPRKWVREWRI